MSHPSPNPPRVLITAGPTREPIDAVRFISNRSSGKLGVALADAADRAGWTTTLLLGPVTSDRGSSAATFATDNSSVSVVHFETTDDLAELLDARFGQVDVLIMAAAVTDYRPARRAEPGTKLRRGDDPLTLRLEPTEDLVARCAARKRADQFVVGFALEEAEHLDRRAHEKLRRKRLDAIVANPLATMAADNIDATILTAGGDRLSPGPMDKRTFAEWLIGWIDAHRHGDRGASGSVSSGTADVHDSPSSTPDD